MYQLAETLYLTCGLHVGSPFSARPRRRPLTRRSLHFHVTISMLPIVAFKQTPTLFYLSKWILLIENISSTYTSRLPKDIAASSPANLITPPSMGLPFLLRSPLTGYIR